VAFIRYKGPYAYLVENERLRVEGESRVRQRVLCYLGREPEITADIIAEVERRFPDATVDWDALRAELAGNKAETKAEPKPEKKRPKRRPPPERAPGKAERPRGDDEWLDWD
jgi:hypothetical protein